LHLRLGRRTVGAPPQDDRGGSETKELAPDDANPSSPPSEHEFRPQLVIPAFLDLPSHILWHVDAEIGVQKDRHTLERVATRAVGAPPLPGSDRLPRVFPQRPLRARQVRGSQVPWKRL